MKKHAEENQLPHRVSSMDAWVTEFKEKGEEFMAQEFNVLKIQKAYKVKHKRITLAFKEGTPSSRLYEGALLGYLRDHQARALTGTAPRGDMERRLQEWMDAVEPRNFRQD